MGRRTIKNRPSQRSMMEVMVPVFAVPSGEEDFAKDAEVLTHAVLEDYLSMERMVEAHDRVFPVPHAAVPRFFFLFFRTGPEQLFAGTFPAEMLADTLAGLKAPPDALEDVFREDPEEGGIPVIFVCAIEKRPRVCALKYVPPQIAEKEDFVEKALADRKVIESLRATKKRLLAEGCAQKNLFLVIDAVAEQPSATMVRRDDVLEMVLGIVGEVVDGVARDLKTFTTPSEDVPVILLEPEQVIFMSAAWSIIDVDPN